MTILSLQQRSRELGRIRMGDQKPTQNGGTRPAKLEKFRLTSASRPLLEQVATLYGGTVQEWSPAGGGPKQWEVYTESNRLPVLVPPQPVSQYFELWSGGGCQRRCDGVTELLKDAPCPCGPDPEARKCKPTTRLNVVLRDVPGIGVWRLESHGYYSAVELPQVAEFLAQAGGYVKAWLMLEERVIKREGQDKRVFMVPILEVDITPAQLMAGEGNVAIGGADPKAVTSTERPALPAAQAHDWQALIADATSREELLGIREEARKAGVDGDAATALNAAMRARAEAIGAVGNGEVDSEEARAAVWAQIVAGSSFDSTEELRQDFLAKTGALVEDASVTDLRSYLVPA